MWGFLHPAFRGRIRSEIEAHFLGHLETAVKPDDRPECQLHGGSYPSCEHGRRCGGARVHEVARLASYEAGGITTSTDDRFESIEYLDFWQTMITAEHNHAWVAEDFTHCVGFAVAGLPGHKVMPAGVMELIGLYVLPEAWGSGVADESHERFVELLGSAPATTEGVLDVWSGNRRARAFYRRHGWDADGRSRPEPGGQSFLRLRLTIPD